MAGSDGMAGAIPKGGERSSPRFRARGRSVRPRSFGADSASVPQLRDSKERVPIKNIGTQNARSAPHHPVQVFALHHLVQGCAATVGRSNSRRGGRWRRGIAREILYCAGAC